MAKFKVGDKVRVRRDLNIGECYSGVVFVKGMNKYKGEIIEIEDIADGDIVFLKGIAFAWLDEMLEEVKEDKMEKTFREVIADIKDGEVWVQTEEGYVTEEIYCIDGEIYLTLKQVRSGFGTLGKYKLKRKEYTFEEAFKAYEEGKEIESKDYKYRKINGIDSFKLVRSKENKWRECEDGFEFHLDEIRGKWYIND